LQFYFADKVTDYQITKCQLRIL